MFLLALLILCLLLLVADIISALYKLVTLPTDRLYGSLVPVALVAGLVYMATRRSRAVQNVSYGFGLPSQMYFDLGTASLKGKLSIWFDNASPQAFQIGNLYLKIMQGSQHVGNVTSGPFTIAAANRTELQTEFRVNLISLGVNLFKLIQTGALAATIDGYVNSSGFNLYIRKDVAVNAPQIPEWVKKLNITV